MGNKVCKTLPKCLKHHKKSRDVVLESKAVISDELVIVLVHDHNHELDVFFTPKSDFADSDVDDQENDSPTFICDICIEEKDLFDLFNLKGCTHFYCSGCTVRYATSKLDDNVTRISCPISDCQGMLELEFYRQILPKYVFDRWGVAL